VRRRSRRRPSPLSCLRPVAVLTDRGKTPLAPCRREATSRSSSPRLFEEVATAGALAVDSSCSHSGSTASTVPVCTFVSRAGRSQVLTSGKKRESGGRTSRSCPDDTPSRERKRKTKRGGGWIVPQKSNRNPTRNRRLRLSLLHRSGRDEGSRRRVRLCTWPLGLTTILRIRARSCPCRP
jgi:hypothetical protein